MGGKRSKRQAGFTLVEIMVVIAILAILSAIAVSGIRAPTEQVDAAKFRTMAAEVADMANNYNAFRNRASSQSRLFTDDDLRSIEDAIPSTWFEDEGNGLYSLNLGLSRLFGDDVTMSQLVMLSQKDWVSLLPFIQFNAAEFVFEVI